MQEGGLLYIFHSPLISKFAHPGIRGSEVRRHFRWAVWWPAPPPLPFRRVDYAPFKWITSARVRCAGDPRGPSSRTSWENQLALIHCSWEGDLGRLREKGWDTGTWPHRLRQRAGDLASVMPHDNTDQIDFPLSRQWFLVPLSKKKVLGIRNRKIFLAIHHPGALNNGHAYWAVTTFLRWDWVLMQSFFHF